jgi:pimeloyl-ACP methyl ester carboxylesterase
MMTRNFTLRNWTLLAAISFGLGGEILLWLLMGGAPQHGLLMSLPVLTAYAATGAFTWWYLLRRDFEFSVWRGLVIGLVIGLIAPSVFWLLGTTVYFLVEKEFPVLDRVINPLEALRLLPQVTLVAWETLGWASAAMSAFVSGVLAYLKVRSLREPPTATFAVRVLNIVGILLVITGLFVLVMGLIPAPTKGLGSQPNPVHDYDIAIAQLENIQTNDLDQNIVEVCKTQWLTQGHKTEKVIVFFHGLSNCPAQFDPLAQEFYNLGYSVIIARFPEHVDISRSPRYMTPTAEAFRPMADSAIDVAHGLGEQVYVLGLSAGGGVAAWVAQERSDVERVVLVAPFYGLVGMPSGLNQWVINILTRLPNISFPGTSPVPYQYLGTATIGIGESMRFAQVPRQASFTEPIRAGLVVLVTVENDSVVSNQMAHQVLAQWEANGANAEEFVFPAELDLPHDVIDIHQVKGNPELVYPILIDLVEGRTPVIP